MKPIHVLLAGIGCLAAAIIVWYATHGSPTPGDVSEKPGDFFGQQEIALPVRVALAWRGTLAKSLYDQRNCPGEAGS